MPRIEIVHYRDSDYGCEHTVFIDGVPASYLPSFEIEYHDFDPGAGNECSNYIPEERYIEGTSPALQALLNYAYDNALNNQYTFHDYEYINYTEPPDGRRPERRCTTCGKED